jgi:hypothetical protein
MELRALQLKMQQALLEEPAAGASAEALPAGAEALAGGAEMRATGAEALPAAGMDVAAEVGAAILDAPPLRPQERLDIYRNAYRLRLIEALADTYAMLERALGDEDFAALGARFVAAHPSVHRSIRWYGAELAEFLERTAPYTEYPVLAELARFEWTLAAVFDSPDAAPIDRSELMRIAPESWATLRFDFHPSLRRLELKWNTVAAWRALSDDEDPPAPEALDEPTPWLLWRQNVGQELKNYFRSLEPLEAHALETARGGASFADVCAAMSFELSDEEIPLRAATFIGTWADSGILTGLRAC